MGWLAIVVIAGAGIGPVPGRASMRRAFERGDVDEAARQGALAGPAVVERALASPDRPLQLAAISAATLVEDRAELLEPLARVAAGPDRRTAIPAARAALAIARELAGQPLPDDLAPEDRATWRDRWAALAGRADRWIELRVIAIETAAALDPALDLTASIADPDPALRAAAIAVAPVPLPIALRAPLAAIVVHDPDDRVALAAAAALCGDLVADPAEPVLAALGGPGLERIRSLRAGHGARAQVHDALRCLAGTR